MRGRRAGTHSTFMFWEGVYVLGSNAGMDVEQWGNTCLIVRRLLAGETVEECMQEFDRLQDEALGKS